MRKCAFLLALCLAVLLTACGSSVSNFTDRHLRADPTDDATVADEEIPAASLLPAEVVENALKEDTDLQRRYNGNWYGWWGCTAQPVTMSMPRDGALTSAHV